MYRCLYPIRSNEIPWIKRNRLKEMKTIIGEDQSETEQFELTTKEFIMTATMYQTNLGYLVHFLDLAIKHGGMVVCISYVLLTAMLGMPLSMLFTFMSSYSKKSYLKFWDCVPLFEGLGYSLATMRLISELYNICMCGVALMMIPKLFRQKAIDALKNCKYAEASCIPMDSLENRTYTCPEDAHDSNKTMVATQFYVRQVIAMYTYSRGTSSTSINQKWLMYISLTWIAIFACGILGLKRIRKITVNLQMLFAMVLLCVIVIAIFHFESHQKIAFMGGSGTGSLLKFDFWVEMILHSAETNVLSNMIWLGSLKPQSLSPKYAAIITSPIKMVILIATVCFTSIFGQEVLNHYRISDQNCLLIEGFDLIFVFVPDVLFRTKIFRLLNLFWYLSIAYFCFIAPLYTVIGLADSIVQRHQCLGRYRLYVYAVLCLCGLLVNISLIINMGGLIIHIWKHFAVPILSSALLVMVNLAICFVYSINSVIDDYTFTYGAPPDKYWVVLWKASPIFSIFAFIFVLRKFRGMENMTSEAALILVSSYGTCSLVLIPVFGILLTRCCKHIKYRTLRSLSKPADDWGPHLEKDKPSRRYFYPHRDVKHRNSVLRCKHKCSAMNKKGHRHEVLKQNEKLLSLKNEYSKYMEEKND